MTISGLKDAVNIKCACKLSCLASGHQPHSVVLRLDIKHHKITRHEIRMATVANEAQPEAAVIGAQSSGLQGEVPDRPRHQSSTHVCRTAIHRLPAQDSSQLHGDTGEQSANSTDSGLLMVRFDAWSFEVIDCSASFARLFGASLQGRSCFDLLMRGNPSFLELYQLNSNEFYGSGHTDNRATVGRLRLQVTDVSSGSSYMRTMECSISFAGDNRSNSATDVVALATLTATTQMGL